MASAATNPLQYNCSGSTRGDEGWAFLKRFVHSEQAFYQEHSVLSDEANDVCDQTAVDRYTVRFLSRLDSKRA